MLATLSRLVSAAAALAAIVSHALAFEVVPAIQPQDPERRSGSPMACAGSAEQSEKLNGLELFQASASCYREQRPFDGTLLLVVAQIRAITDLSTLRALGDTDEVAIAELYGLVLYQSAGAGFDALYRDPALTDELFRRLDAWNPLFSDDYDPGWNHKKEVDPGSYMSAANYHKARRIVQLQHYASLVRRDDYHAAGRELGELRRRNPAGFAAKSHDAARAVELMKLMRQIDQESQFPIPFHHELVPDADFRQLFVGTNGPSSGGVLVLESRRAAKASWLAKAVAPGKLEKLLSEVDFEHQILIAFSVGERATATGALSITEVSYNGMLDFMSIVGQVGENELDCPFSPAKSYLFALAVAERPPSVPEFPRYAVASFGDGCKPPRSGQPSD